MAILKGLFSLLGSLPDIISFLKFVGEGTEAVLHFVDGRIKLSAFDKAAEKAQNAKDTSDLESVFKS